MFTGFNLKYPDYEVITPQTNKSYHLRSLSVQEEERLKGSLMTPVKVADHLNKCIYETCTKKPEEVKDFESFLKSLTLKDRDSLLYGLYHITYEEIRNYNIKCGSCSKEYPVTIKASDTFNFNTYTGSDILTKQHEIKLPVSKGVSAFIKQPTLYDESKAMKELSSRPGSTIDIITETLIIEKFSQDITNNKEPKIWSDRIDIIDAYKSLPARDKRIINESYAKHFGQYGIDLKMKVICQYCGVEEVVEIDIVSNFFRTLYAS